MLRDRESYSPPGTGGVAVPSTIWPKASFERHGRGGQSRMTTPSALSKVASRYFLDAQPPLLSEEGTKVRLPSRRARKPQAQHAFAPALFLEITGARAKEVAERDEAQ